MLCCSVGVFCLSSWSLEADLRSDPGLCSCYDFEDISAFLCTAARSQQLLVGVRVCGRADAAGGAAPYPQHVAKTSITSFFNHRFVDVSL